MAKTKAPAKKAATKPSADKAASTTATTATAIVKSKKKKDGEKTWFEILHDAANSSKELKRYHNYARGLDHKEKE